MNKRSYDVLLALASRNFENQRELASFCGCSLGAVNACVKTLSEDGYIDGRMVLTAEAERLLLKSAPKRAVLLASQYGVRAFSAAHQTPKALLNIQGEALIERIIKQLNEVGVFEIYVVVGFKKEQFEYLIDKYNVELLVNTEYSKRQTLYSLSLAEAHLDNCYIVPCDIWCKQNPFCGSGLYSWYMVTDKMVPDSLMRVNRKEELAVVSANALGNDLTGIAYVTADTADVIRARLKKMRSDRRSQFALWEDALLDGGKFLLHSRLIDEEKIRRVDSFEDMLELDSQMAVPVDDIAQILGVAQNEIKNIEVLKKGAVNSSYTFVCKGEKYVVRVPSYGATKMAIQSRESAVYQVLRQHDIVKETIYQNDSSGLKISRYIDSVRRCDPFDDNDVRMCLAELRKIHEKKLKVEHRFDLFEVIDYFESLWGNEKSIYSDYEETKKNVFSLKRYIDKYKQEECLTHIDPVAENFLISLSSANEREVYLIDWEYAAMQDPHLDIAMFCLYSLYNRQGVDRAIELYFGGKVQDEIRIKIYCYMAVGGLLWSNWCESKYNGGTEFGVYALRQYRYAKEYYRIVNEELKGAL